MEMHASGTARVIPVILRACDWQGSPFEKLQAVPKDGQSVMSWDNHEEAFTDVAKRIRVAVEEMASKLGANDPMELSGGSAAFQIERILATDRSSVALMDGVTNVADSTSNTSRRH